MSRIVWTIPWLLLSIHSIAVIAVAIFIGTHRSESGEVIMVWLIFLLIDFPLGYLIIPISDWLGPIFKANASDFVRHVVWYAVWFLVLGGAQYFCIGKLIVFWLNRRLLNR